MAASKKNPPTPATSSKQTRKQIEKKLEAALATLEPLLGKKKFKKRVKKAGKVLANGLKGKATPPESSVKPKAAKKGEANIAG